MKKINILLLFTLLVNIAYAQQQFDIRFNMSSVDCDTRQVCYDVQLKTSTSTSWNLAGQNYRVFYDNSKADFSSGSSTLGSDYGPFNVVADSGPLDASGTSVPLGFKSTIGFLNYSMDLSNLSTGGIDLTTNWMTTSNLCFTVEQSVIDDGSSCVELVWGRDGLTNEIATAFVEASSWDGPNTTNSAEIVLHDDLTSADGDQACFNTSCASAAVPSITIADASVQEGQTAQPVICLDLVASQDISINYSTSNGSATSGSDFQSSTGVATILTGQTCTAISIATIDVADVESTESFIIQLSSASFGNITDGTASISIVDNDVACAAQAPTISGN